MRILLPRMEMIEHRFDFIDAKVYGLGNSVVELWQPGRGCCSGPDDGCCDRPSEVFVRGVDVFVRLIPMLFIFLIILISELI